MSKAQVIHQLGPPSVMQWEDWPVPEPPVVIGFEGVGVVEGVGDEVTDFKTGDRVANGIPPPGNYAELRNYPADMLLHLPDGLDDKQVAALLMKGMTAHYLPHRTYQVRPGDTILVHAAAEGMGLLLCQWAEALGAKIAGTVSTPEKAEAARLAGCLYPVVRSEQNFLDIVREVTDGEVVRLSMKSSAKTRYKPRWTARDLFKAIGDGVLNANINYEHPPKEAVKAHEAIEAGKTLGATVLIP